MGTIRTLIGQSLSVAIVVVLIFSLMPFVEPCVNSMMGVYGDMADAVMSGSGGEYAGELLDKMDASSQVVIGELGSMAEETVEKAGGSEILDSIINFLNSLH